jgi:hypothetical protein
VASWWKRSRRWKIGAEIGGLRPGSVGGVLATGNELYAVLTNLIG